MSPEKTPDVMAVHRGQRVALMDCGCQIPVTDWFDATGQDCNPADAIVCVCGDDAHGWFTVDLQALKTVTVH